MLSSLASFLFGSSTSATTNSEVNQNPTGQAGEPTANDNTERIDAENLIEVTASAPSVAGSSQNSVYRQQGKRGKNRRNRSNNKNQAQAQAQRPKSANSSITKLLTPNVSVDEDFNDDDDDWFIVEKEGEEDSLPRTDSEEELSSFEVKPRTSTPEPTSASASGLPPALLTPIVSRRRPIPYNSHSLYSGPRPQQQRNYLQRVRNSGARSAAPLNASRLSPPRSIVSGAGIGSNVAASAGAAAALAAATATAAAVDGGMTQSLYVVSNHNTSGSSNSSNGANVSMDGSWYVTPPPCFTSIGPINMETSPFENLLIEHPSMSVYRSIRSAQEATDSFVNLDLGAENSRNQRRAASTPVAAQTGRTVQTATPRAAAPRIENFTATQLKQELLVRTSQKTREKKERQNLCRGAIKRSNKVREVQSKGGRPRRADMQHCNVKSGANNNRKCF